MNTLSIRHLAASMRGDLPVIDLHGIQDMRSAEEQLESQLFLFSERREDACRVIHGIGTGRMKEMVEKVLKKNPLIEKYTVAPDGGSSIVLFYI